MAPVMILLGNFAKEFNLQNPILRSSAPLYVIEITKPDMSIKLDFLYGPPEFHLEMILVYNPNKMNEARYGLAELFRNISIKKWVYDQKFEPMDNGKALFEQEAEWYCKMLTETCKKAFENPADFFKDLDIK